jgi:hypothetical protein
MAIQSKLRSLIVTAVTGIAFAALVMAAPILADSVSPAQAQVSGEPAPQAKPPRPLAPQMPPPPAPRARLQTLTPPPATLRPAPPPLPKPPVAKPLTEPVTRPVAKPVTQPIAHPKPPVVKKLPPRKKSKPGTKQAARR